MIRTWLKRISVGALAIVIAVLGTALLLLNTEWGARVVLSQTDRFVPGELRIERVSGTLAGPLVLEDSDWRREGLSVEAGRLSLDLSLTEMLAGRARVDDLAIKDLVIRVPEAGEPDPRPDPGPVRLPALNLPVSVTVERALLDDARLHLPGFTDPLVVDGMSLRGALVGGAIELAELALESPYGELSLEAGIDTRANYRSRARARVLWRHPEGPLEGRLEIAGDLEALDLTVSGEAPAAFTLEAGLRELLVDPAAGFTVELDGLPPALLGLDGLPGPLRGRLQGNAGTQSLEVGGWLDAAGEGVDIEALALSWSANTLRLDRLELVGRESARLSAQGELILGDEAPRVSLSAEWADIRLPLADQGVLESPSGRVGVDGRPEDYRFRSEFRTGGVVPAGDWQLSGSGSLAGVNLSRLAVETLEGRMEGSGSLAWEPALSWDLELEVRQLDPASLAPDWPGALSGGVALSGERDGDQVRGELAVTDLSGTLRGRPVAGAAEVRFHGDETLEGRLAFDSGDSRLVAEGRYGERTDARARITSPDLGDWLPDAEGSLDATLELEGPRGALRFTGEVRGESLALEGLSVAELRGRFDLGLAGTVDSEAVLAGQGLSGFGYAAEHAGLTLRGTPGSHALTLEAAEADHRLELAARGGLEQQAWAGELQRLSLDAGRLGLWQLTRPTPLELAASAFRLDDFCLRADGGSLCGHGRWRADEGLEASARLEEVPMAAAQPWLRNAMQRPVELEGALHMALDLRVPPQGGVTARVTVSSREAAMSLPGPAGVTRLALSPLAGELHLEEGALEGGVELGIEDAGRVTGEFRATDFQPERWTDAPVSGRLDVALERFGPLAPLMVPLAAPEGRLAGELTVGGHLGAPELAGDLTLADFAVEVPQAGLALSNGGIVVSADGDGLRFEGGVESGPGRIALEGEITPGGPDGVRAEARVTGERFLAVSRPGLEAEVSPDLTLTLVGMELRVRGEVSVPRAVIDAGKLEGGGVSASPDVVMVGREDAEPEARLRVFAEVGVSLGESVVIRAPGFEGSARGRLHVSERPGRPALGRGELTVTGSYEAYGQSLSIRRGRLLFSDTPVDDPALEVEAIREVDEITAGVRIAGSARNPQLVLFSEPTLQSDADVLSYLILGRPMDRATAGDGAVLSGAATTLGLRGGDLLARQIGARFGIADIGVEESEDLGQSALTLGKYLSPRLYVSYGMGLVESASVIRMRYELSQRWAVEAASGRETSGAIKFFYER